MPLRALVVRLRRNHPSRAAAAYVRMDPLALDTTPPPASARVCEAPGCGRRLTATQVARGAKTCSAPCRARAHRERKRARRLAEIDAAVKTLLDLRRDCAGMRARAAPPANMVVLPAADVTVAAADRAAYAGRMRTSCSNGPTSASWREPPRTGAELQPIVPIPLNAAARAWAKLGRTGTAIVLYPEPE